MHKSLPPNITTCHSNVCHTLFNTLLIPTHNRHNMYKNNINTLAKTLGVNVDDLITTAQKVPSTLHSTFKVEPLHTAAPDKMEYGSTMSHPTTTHDTIKKHTIVKKPIVATRHDMHESIINQQQMMVAMQMAMEMANVMVKAMK